MFANTRSYSGFAVDELHSLVYEESGVSSASYTSLNFEVADVDQAVDDLSACGVRFERYESLDQDSNGIYRHEGPYVAWFKDPSGNVLSVVQER